MHADPQTGQKLSAVTQPADAKLQGFSPDETLAVIRNGRQAWVAPTRSNGQWRPATSSEKAALDAAGKQGEKGGNALQRAVGDPKALIFTDDKSLASWAISTAGKVMRRSASGATQIFGQLTQADVRALGSASDPNVELWADTTSQVATLPDGSGMICGAGPCVVLDGPTGRSTMMPQAGCMQPEVVDGENMFVCAYGGRDDIHYLNFFTRVHGTWKAVNLLPDDISSRFEGGYYAKLVTMRSCSERLILYGTDHTDDGYEGSLLWDFGEMRPVKVFDNALVLVASPDGGSLLTTMPVTKTLSGGSVQHYQADAVPIICDRADGNKLVEQALARAGQHTPKQLSISDWVAGRLHTLF